jgi:hypothetical protein
MKLNTVQKDVFRQHVMSNDTGIKVSISSFFRFLEEQQAPMPIQKVIVKTMKDMTPGKEIELTELYNAA